MKIPNTPQEPEPPRPPDASDRGAPETGDHHHHLEMTSPTVDEAALADDFTAGTDAPLGRAGVERALAND
jgi:hypothetical protein